MGEIQRLIKYSKNCGQVISLSWHIFLSKDITPPQAEGEIRSRYYLWISPEMMLDELCTCPCKCLISHYKRIPGITNLTFLVALLHPPTVLPALSEGFGSGCRGSCAVPGAADGLCCMPTSSRAELKFCSWAVGAFWELHAYLWRAILMISAKIYPRVHNNHSSSFERGCLGRVLDSGRMSDI